MKDSDNTMAKISTVNELRNQAVYLQKERETLAQHLENGSISAREFRENLISNLKKTSNIMTRLWELVKLIGGKNIDKDQD